MSALSSSSDAAEQQQVAAAAAKAPVMIWPTDANSYEFVGKIGQGAFATVWRASTKAEDSGGDNAEDGAATSSNKTDCAVKVLNLDNVDCNLAEIRSEVQAMRLSSHANVLPCYTAFCHETNLWLVTQFMNKGSSLHCLQTARRVIRKQQQSQQQQRQPQAVNMEQYIFYILHQTLLGLQYIHENGQIHRDIKAGNILLDGYGGVKIADFGVSGWLTKGGRASHTKAKTFVGTPCWMAPEVMEQVHGYDTKADIWSLGITALELAKGYAPYAKYPPMKVLILTIQEDPPSLDTYNDEDMDSDDHDLLYCQEDAFSRQFAQFVDTCLQKNPSKRPTTEGLLSSKFMSDLQDESNREKRRMQMVEQVCSIVPDVGSSEHNNNQGSQQQLQQQQRIHMPGHAPISILMTTEKDRPAGTTWVFADGSSTNDLTSSQQQYQQGDDDDVLAELDQFERETGGEHYQGRTQQQDQGEEEAHGAGDELSAFMDEFEQNTAGEDFRR